VLLAETAAREAVQPIYVSVGLAWERAERQMVDAYLAAAAFAHPVCSLVSLSVDMTDVYPRTHWAREGRAPGYDTPDEDVYLAGRNIVLLGKAAIFCAAAGIHRLAIGTLDHNPFPDATPAFRGALAHALSLGLDHAMAIEAPYARTEKSEVIRRGSSLGARMDLTLSCMSPATEEPGLPRHCGTCSKCRERHDAFVAAGVEDPTDYAETRFTARNR